METQPEINCPACKSAVSANAYFCSNCGKQLKDKLPVATLSKQIILYAVSLFLPPFGFFYAWKYLKSGDSKSKKIGAIAVILTIISILITIRLTEEFFNSVNQALNSISDFGL